MVLAVSGSVFIEDDVEHPVQTILHGTMGTSGMEIVLCIRQTGYSGAYSFIFFE